MFYTHPYIPCQTLALKKPAAAASIRTAEILFPAINITQSTFSGFQSADLVAIVAAGNIKFINPIACTIPSLIS